MKYDQWGLWTNKGIIFVGRIAWKIMSSCSEPHSAQLKDQKRSKNHQVKVLPSSMLSAGSFKQGCRLLWSSVPEENFFCWTSAVDLAVDQLMS